MTGSGLHVHIDFCAFREATLKNQSSIDVKIIVHGVVTLYVFHHHLLSLLETRYSYFYRSKCLLVVYGLWV